VVSGEDAVAISCVNVACPEQRVRRVGHFAAVMDIEGLGERTAQLLVEHGLMQDAADLYYLKPEDLLELEGFAEKSVNNLLTAIEAAKERPLTQLMAALGIQGVGGTVAQLLAQRYRSLEELGRAGREELEAIEGMGPRTAGSILAWFSRSRNRAFIEKLRQAGVKLEQESTAVPAEGPLEGLTFVITGTLPTMSREEATGLIERHGGRVTGGVSGRTDYLVVGDAPGGTKYRRAQQLGVPTIEEAGLLEMIGLERGGAAGETGAQGLAQNSGGEQTSLPLERE
jgi:DNA ligase (NAD+)